jgi:hypothetical protein
VYFGFSGGSALLHLLAAHPKVVAVFGVIGTLALLTTSLGPHNHFGAGQQMRRLDKMVTTNELVNAEALEHPSSAARRIAAMAPADIERAVREVLRECGRNCADLTPAIVMKDRTLLNTVLYVAEADRYADRQPISPEQRTQLLSRR